MFLNRLTNLLETVLFILAVNHRPRSRYAEHGEEEEGGEEPRDRNDDDDEGPDLDVRENSRGEETGACTGREGN